MQIKGDKIMCLHDIMSCRKIPLFFPLPLFFLSLSLPLSPIIQENVIYKFSTLESYNLLSKSCIKASVLVPGHLVVDLKNATHLAFSFEETKQARKNNKRRVKAATGRFRRF